VPITVSLESEAFVLMHEPHRARTSPASPTTAATPWANAVWTGAALGVDEADDVGEVDEVVLTVMLPLLVVVATWRPDLEGS
jgi:hypothetical protein